MDNKEFFAALEAMEEERGIPKEFLADKIADAVGADVVQVIGRKFVLYRKSKENQKIFLKTKNKK